MKNLIKNIMLTSLVFFCVNYVNQKVNPFLVSMVIEKQDTIKAEPSYVVTATMYYPTTSQCDSDPLLTAGMYRIKPGKASEQKWIAMSRDMLKRWGGEFNYGDIVRIEGAGHKDGEYKVVDTMNKRFKSRIDFLEDTGTKHYKFNNVKLTKVEWKSQENHLATL